MISIPPQNDRLATDGIEFVFREVRTAQEMRDVLELRYRVYAANRVESSLDHASGLEIEAYDLASRHFALFARSGRRESVVGALRFYLGRISPQAALLHAVSAAHPTVAALLAMPRRAALPMLAYLEAGEKLDAYLASRLACGERVVEVGRLVLDPRILTATGRHGLRLSHHMMLSAIAFACHVDPVDRVLIDARCTAPHLERLYRRFGFSRVADVPPIVGSEAGLSYIVLEATPGSVPGELRRSIDELGAELGDRGEATAILTPKAPRTAVQRSPRHSVPGGPALSAASA